MVNRRLGYFELIYSALDRKAEATTWKNENLTSQWKSRSKRFFLRKAGADMLERKHIYRRGNSLEAKS